MKTAIERTIAVLMGRALWTCRCTAGLASFHFGQKQASKTFDGKTTDVGQYALNVQCPWRITRGEKVAVGSGDIYYPVDLQIERTPAGFDPAREPNRRDKLLQALFESQNEHFTVRSIAVGSAGSLHIEMELSLSLDILPDNSLSNEHWRFFSPNSNGKHFIVSGEGIQT